MPNVSLSNPSADCGHYRHLVRDLAADLVEDWDRCILGNGPVLPGDTDVSGWHSLLSMTYAVEQWFWDAVILAWREWPRAFTAETPRTLGGEGYAYLSAIAPPW